MTKDPDSSWGIPKILFHLGHWSQDTAPSGIDSVSSTTGEIGSETGSPGIREVSQTWVLLCHTSLLSPNLVAQSYLLPEDTNSPYERSLFFNSASQWDLWMLHLACLCAMRKQRKHLGSLNHHISKSLIDPDCRRRTWESCSSCQGRAEAKVRFINNSTSICYHVTASFFSNQDLAMTEFFMDSIIVHWHTM